MGLVSFVFTLWGTQNKENLALNPYLKIDNRALPARSMRNYWQDKEQNHCKKAKHHYSSRYNSSNDEKYTETGAEK